ncbi:class I SAM-dependent methyltransferase [Bythopirellula polymerisocia]|uniref:Demethylrebeccamycin-D-glucose O-methyltransferase n=1 Tax=Bythopirellula polymerisocia TaxID=2528003 RepID=A0A5C6D0J9_9BACT|nr:class I SAM-dependent methyltransferase [Bythopirellula polymerisocia]TWU29354.1 Demethylrebeccamycin-D-glucose O-methyltransferase [Bythopirellula polymerisocia]
MVHQPSNPPYFDGLLHRLAIGEARTAAAFSRHVHWGYWHEPPQATCTPEEYGEAAELLSRVLCDVAGIGDGMRVVDVGCGFGGTIASLNERLGEMLLIGVNIDPRQLQRASDMVRPCGINSLKWVEADAAQIPLADASCDVALALESVFHFDRPRFFAEVGRLLAPGGNLTLSDFVPSERAAEYLDAIDFSADEAVRWSYGQIDLACSLSRYRELAKANNLELTQAIDITENTLPTYDFLYSSTKDWPESREVELFSRATRLLEKASRKGMLGYQVLRFDRL